MAKRDEVVISHWYKLFEGIQESPKQFYHSIEEIIAQKELHEISTTRKNYFEGGPMSAQREYFRVSRRDLAFDICAAHFGKGMFVSWWLSEDRSSKGVWILMGLLMVAFLLLYSLIDQLGFVVGLFVGIIFLFAIFLFVSIYVHSGEIRMQDTLLEIPIVGPLYERIFHPVTFYKIDTALMFQESIRSAVSEALDKIMNDKGIRALTEEEKAPIMSELSRR